MIQKKIHYCWFGPKPFPKIVQKCIATWKVHFPDYQFFLWTEENSPMHVSFVKEAYAAKKYAFVSDYVRFWALYNEGGIYLDTDMFVIRSFEDLLNNDCFFAYEDPDNNFISCGVIGCNKNDEFIKIILDKYNSLRFKIEELNKLVIPRLITPIYKKKADNLKIHIYPFDYFYPFPYLKRDGVKNFHKYSTKNTYAIHLWNLSWVSPYNKMISRIVKNIKRIFKL